MVQRSFFFSVEDQRRLGVLFPAEGAAARPRVVVMMSAFGAEHVVCRPHLADLARQLAEDGIPGLRFDYGGYGDSQGDFQDACPASMRADTAAAIAQAKAASGAPAVALVGVRMGATLAAQVAAERTDVDRLILIEPLPKLEKYLFAELRATVAMQTMMFGEVRVTRDAIMDNIRAGRPSEVEGYDMNLIHDGFPLGRALVEQAAEVDLIATPPKLACPTLILHQRERAGRPPKDLLTLQEALTAAAGEAAQVSLETVVEPSVMWKHGRYYTAFSPEVVAAVRGWLAAQEEA